MPPLKPNLTKAKALIDSHQFELSEFWAKTDEFALPSMSVISHSIICAEIATLLLSFKTEEFRSANYLKYLSLFASLHDVGKIVPAFQIKCEYWAKKYKISSQNYICQYDARHSSYSKEIVLKEYKDTQAFENWADVVGSHHGFLSNEVNLNNIASSWEKYRSEFVEYFKKIYGNFPLELNENKISNEISYLITGIITFADWLASDVDLFPVKNYTMQEAKLIIKDKLLNSDFKNKILCDFKKLDNDDIFDFPLNSLQLAALDSYKGRGIYLIEAPMGMGKTEASLLLAYKLISEKKASGIYFALPTQLTSNVIYGRLNSFLKEVSIQSSTANLIHSASWIEEIYEGKSDLSSWFNSSKKALLSSFGVGTIDQALMMLLPVKHWHLRYYGLSDKVVILDEIHSYDAYTSTLIKRLISHLEEMGATVIILSATLTKTQRAKLLNTESIATLDSAKFPSIIYRTKRMFILKI
ncbi:MAG: CRISPR-associated helicase Cas3' [Opitutales bacterium]